VEHWITHKVFGYRLFGYSYLVTKFREDLICHFAITATLIFHWFGLKIHAPFEDFTPKRRIKTSNINKLPKGTSTDHSSLMVF